MLQVSVFKDNIGFRRMEMVCHIGNLAFVYYHSQTWLGLLNFMYSFLTILASCYLQRHFDPDGKHFLSFMLPSRNVVGAIR